MTSQSSKRLGMLLIQMEGLCHPCAIYFFENRPWGLIKGQFFPQTSPPKKVNSFKLLLVAYIKTMPAILHLS